MTRKHFPRLCIERCRGEACVDRGVLDVGMSQPILYKRMVCPSIKEMRGNRMLQAMELPLPHRQSCLLPKRPHYFIGRLRRKLEEYLQKIFHIPSYLVVTPNAGVASLPLGRFSPIVGHQQHRPSDLRMTHAQHDPPDPRKPDHHCRFSQRSDLLSAAWRRQGVCRMRARVPPRPWFSAHTQDDVSGRGMPDPPCA